MSSRSNRLQTRALSSSSHNRRLSVTTSALALCLSSRMLSFVATIPVGANSFSFGDTSHRRMVSSRSILTTSRRMVSTVDQDSADLARIGDGHWNTLPYEMTSHNSVTITVPPSEEHSVDCNDQRAFRERLEATVEAARGMNKSSIWVEIPMSRARLMEEMVELGFEFHHAQGSTAKLNLWLREEWDSMVPEFATHHIGVGSIVINSRDEILCVRELRRNNILPWKIPGGLSEVGEDIPLAAEREVLEETGIRARFDGILSFRQTHGMANGRSDLYFVCRLVPLEGVDEDGNVVIPQPYPQESEIEDAQWVPMSDYRDLVNGITHETGHPMMRHVLKVMDEGQEIKTETVASIIPGRKPSTFYQSADDASNVFN